MVAARLSRITLDPSQVQTLQDEMAQPLDWTALVDAARWLRTTPMVDRTLDGLGGRADVPKKTRAVLGLESERWRRWNERLVAEAETLLDILRTEGFRVVPLKGLDYALRLYPEVGLRPMADVDLLVPDGLLDPVCDFLKAREGFTEKFEVGSARGVGFYRKRILVRRSGRDPTYLDVHSVFYHPDLYPVDYRALWARLEDARELPAEDCLLLSCLTLAKDRYQSDLRDVVDIHEILCRWGADWPVVLTRARRWGVRTALFFSLSVARCVLDSPVPEAVLEKCRPGWLRRSWLNLLLQTERYPVYRFSHGEVLPKLLLRLPLADSARARWGFLANHARYMLGMTPRAPGARNGTAPPSPTVVSRDRSGGGGA